MKRKIFLKPYNHKIFYNNKIFGLNNGHNAFFAFDSFLKKHNISAQTLDKDSITSGVVCLYADLPYPWEICHWFQILFGAHKKRILVVLESPIINPFNQYRFLWRLFDTVLTWNSDVKSKNNIHILIPQLDSAVITPQKKEKLLVIINANKRIPFIFRLFSITFENLYSKRIKAIEALSRIIPGDFDLYGKGWSNYECNRGEIEEGRKLEVLSKYRFSICFENTIAKGYITEKIFDCFKAGVVPVYLGAPDISRYIPADCYIDFRKFESYTALIEHVQNIDDKTYNGILNNIKTFLKSNDYKKWSQETFFKTILKEINHV